LARLRAPQPDADAPVARDGRLADWRRNGPGSPVLAAIGLGKLRVLGTPRRPLRLGGYGLEVVDYVPTPGSGAGACASGSTRSIRPPTPRSRRVRSGEKATAAIVPATTEPVPSGMPKRWLICAVTTFSMNTNSAVNDNPQVPATRLRRIARRGSSVPL